MLLSTYPKAEILFPSRLIPDLEDLRGPQWQELVRHVAQLPGTHPDHLAFCLMMIRLDGCLKCTNGSFRYMRGCLICARQTIAQLKDSDEELIRLFRRCQVEVTRYLAETTGADELGQAA